MNKLKRGIAFLLIFALVAVCIPQIASALTPEEIQKLEELEELKRQLENVEREIKELQDEKQKLREEIDKLPPGNKIRRMAAMATLFKLEENLTEKQKERNELLEQIEKKRQELADLGTPEPPTPSTTKLTATDAEGRTWTVEALESAPDALNGADTLKIEKNAKGNYVAKLFKGGAEISSRGLLWVYQPIPAGVTAKKIKVDGVETTFSVVGNTWKYAAEFKK